ncbi:MAG: GNAT family N-acetyltransferase [Ktedonobacterales bacterium]
MEIYLETGRLLLRPLTPDDVENLFELDSDPEVMHYLTGGAPSAREAIQNRILPGFLNSSERFPGFGVWAAIDKASGKFLGWFAFRPHSGADPSNVSLGYRLRRAAWGHGYATEVARALIRKGFSELGVQRVYATTYEHNLASRRVMEKAGLALVRRFRLSPADLEIEESFDGAAQADDEAWEGDEVEYALLKSDWEEREAALPPDGVC